MSNNDHLANGLSKINNSEKAAKKELTINIYSKIIKQVLDILHKNDYLGKIAYIENRKGGKINIELINKINECGAIKPRFKVKVAEIEKFEQRYLPAKAFGLLVISTSKGMMTNKEAKEKRVGGRLIAYCY